MSKNSPLLLKTLSVALIALIAGSLHRGLAEKEPPSVPTSRPGSR